MIGINSGQTGFTEQCVIVVFQTHPFSHNFSIVTTVSNILKSQMHCNNGSMNKYGLGP